MRLGGGERGFGLLFEMHEALFLEIAVDGEAWRASIHAATMKCRGCHQDISEHPHPDPGVKSVLDIGRTLEYLETKGVAVVGYRTDRLPAFYTRSSRFPVDFRAETPAEIAAALNAKREMGLSGGTVVANPIPAEHAISL